MTAQPGSLCLTTIAQRTRHLREAQQARSIGGNTMPCPHGNIRSFAGSDDNKAPSFQTPRRVGRDPAQG
ncbi:hypothetical protein ACMAUO_19755 [Gluconacetobacter sp. Hr-1-5]|uniref:hypothetical protein n=1 Tax=Gluconacetobacter sp. Hr-1-5 TaxID=3395370 RepID=UPI003B51979D